MSVDYYKILGVDPEADIDTIKAAYRKKAAKCHPDRRGGSHREMLLVNEAWDVLSDVKRRRAYDEMRAQAAIRSAKHRKGGTRQRKEAPADRPAGPDNRARVDKDEKSAGGKVALVAGGIAVFLAGVFHVNPLVVLAIAAGVGSFVFVAKLIEAITCAQVQQGSGEKSS